MLRTALLPRSTHSSPPYSTAHASPTNTKNKNTSFRVERAQRAQSRNPLITPQPTAHAAPTHNTVISATQALNKLEQKLEQRLRVAATNFSNTAAQGFVQRSLPQMLFGGHWLTEKFQFLSTLAWQTGDDEGGILGELDIVVPLYGTRNAAEIDQTGWFLQPGLVSWEADNGDRRLDVNIGLTHRRLLRKRIAIGAAVFYDHNIDSDLKRIGAGADIISPYTYLAVNYYEPLSGWRSGERLGYEERALRGVDVNIEQALWDSHWVLEASGGYWKGYDADNRKGEWQPAGSVGIRYYPLDYLSVYADYAYHHDHVDTDRFGAGVEFSYPGKQRGIGENVVDVWRPMTREKRILYAERKKRVTPTLTLTTPPAAVTAGNSISLLITSDIAVPGTLTLSLTISGQVAASDFTANTLTPSVSANFNGGSTAMVTIATVRDADALETYTITLASGSNYRVGETTEVSGNIVPSGIVIPGTGTTMPTLTLATDPADTAGGAIISLLVTSDIAVAGTLTLPLTISGQVAVGDFVNGLIQSVEANFNGGTTATVTIATVKDTDAVETYTITLGSGTGYSIGSDSTAAGRITVALPILTLANDPVVASAGALIFLRVTSDEAIAGTLTLSLTISDRGSSGITAADFANGLSQSISANFGGSTTVDIVIATVEDTDAVETYTITLGSGTGYTVGGDNTADGTLNPVPATLTLLTNPLPVTAGNAISLVVTSDRAITGSLTVNLFIGDSSSGITAGDFSISLRPVSRGRVFGSVTANFNGGRTATITIGTTRDSDTMAEMYTISLGGDNLRRYLTANPSPSVMGTINP